MMFNKKATAFTSTSPCTDVRTRSSYYTRETICNLLLPDSLHCLTSPAATCLFLIHEDTSFVSLAAFPLNDQKASAEVYIGRRRRRIVSAGIIRSFLLSVRKEASDTINAADKDSNLCDFLLRLRGCCCF